MGEEDVQETYAIDQGRLREELEGGASEEDDFHLKAPVPPEVNPEVYKDVEPLLFRGFLLQQATINHVSFVFKSLNHHEFEMLQFLGNGSDRKSQQHLYDIFMAYGVAMVDGANVLADREEWLPQIADTFSGLDRAVREKVVYHLSELNRRAGRAMVLTEAYALESQSRLRWAQYNGISLMHPSITGILGTERLGMNWGQLTWRALNYYEDMRDLSEREWENAKFVASAMAGKGMNKVHSQDRRRRQQEAEDRLERKTKILRFAMLGEPIGSSDGRYGDKIVARTVEELAQQMEKDIKGEKDWHDMIVDAVQQKMVDERSAKMEGLRLLQEERSSKYGDRPITGGTSLKGIRPEEVKYHIEKRRQLAAHELAMRPDHAEFHDPKMGEFMDKWAPIEDESGMKRRALPIIRGKVTDDE